jgi:hypothetical protein
MAQTIAYRGGEPAPHFIFDVQRGGLGWKMTTAAGDHRRPDRGRVKCRHAA